MKGRSKPLSLDRIRGVVPAHGGAGHWWKQRVTAIALAPLTLWLAASLIKRAADDYDAFILWLHAPLTAILMSLLLVAVFYHLALGLQVVIEDYVHNDRIRSPIVVAVHIASIAIASGGIVAVLCIAIR